MDHTWPFRAYPLWLLNSSRTPVRWGSGWSSKVLLVAAALMFRVLFVEQVRSYL